MDPETPRRARETLSTVKLKAGVAVPPPDPGAAWLVVIYGDELGRRIVLEPEGTVIGRASGCTVQIDQPAISRAHAGLRRRDGAWHVRDLGSTNGTLVNEAEISGEVTLSAGDTVQIGRMLTKFLSGATAEGQYFDAIHRLTTTDGLTDLVTRRHFNELLARELTRALRYQRTFSLLALDVDHFKKINDDHGHVAGDAVLRQLGAVLRSGVRVDDVPARLGGEELAVLAPETGHAGAATLAERLRARIESTDFLHAGKRVPITVSIGVTTWTPPIRTVETLLQNADTLLYQAKRAGRNRVVTDATG